MDQATQFFDELKSFSTQEELLEYCKNTLGDVESLHYDYKTKSDSRNPKLNGDDKKNLAKAISGFSNSAGGVLIWGIKDEGIKPKPIAQVEIFLRNLLHLATNVTEPAAQGVDGHWVPADECDDGTGFAFVLIPESDAPPHRVILKENDIRGRYYFRSASSFLEASHSQLEDMFGRRPRPKLVLRLKKFFRTYDGFTVTVKAEFQLRNEGRALAKYPLIIVELPTGAEGDGTFFTTKSSDIFEEGGLVGTCEMDQKVVHPGVDLDVTGLKFSLKKFAPGQTITLNCLVGAEGQQLTPYTLTGCYPTKRELGI